MYRIPIKPKHQYTDDRSPLMTALEIGAVTLVPSECITLLCSLQDENSISIETVCVVVAGDEYQEWGSDDSYLIDLILKKTACEKL